MKNVILVAKQEYIKWLVNSKFIIFVVIMLILRELKIEPLLSAAYTMESPINMLEPCIAIVNSEEGIMLLGLVYLFLMSSFPTTDENVAFYISRMGRRNWILGEFLFQVLASFTYVILLTIITILQVVRQSFFDNGWSLIVTEYDNLYSPEAGSKILGIISPDLYFQLPPFSAYLISIAMLALFLIICGVIYLIGCLYQKKIMFLFIQGMHIVMGFVLMSAESNAKWLMPISHSLLAIHYNGYFRKYIFSPVISLILLFVLLILAMIIVYRKAKSVSIDLIGGEM